MSGDIPGGVPVALTIAGSDSSGGAGIQADLKTFQTHGVHGTCVITSVTAQNTRSISQSLDLPPQIVQAQLEAVLGDFKIRAVKTGMLANSKMIAAVSQVLSRKKIKNLVVDPVMISKSGFRLLQTDAVRALNAKLLPWARLVTPNFHEAEILSGIQIDSPEKMKEAAKIIGQHGPAVLIKGGHSPFQKACDLLWDGKSFHFFRGRFVKNKTPHGTGCVYSAAITAQLALGHKLHEAVANAKTFVQKAVAESIRLGAGNEIISLQEPFRHKSNTLL